MYEGLKCASKKEEMKRRRQKKLSALCGGSCNVDVRAAVRAVHSGVYAKRSHLNCPQGVANTRQVLKTNNSSRSSEDLTGEIGEDPDTSYLQENDVAISSEGITEDGSP